MALHVGWVAFASRAGIVEYATASEISSLLRSASPGAYSASSGDERTRWSTPPHVRPRYDTPPKAPPLPQRPAAAEMSSSFF
eukprot:SAG22_NODE_2614_length_2379_cov_1.589035_2_plen_82_part_00